MAAAAAVVIARRRQDAPQGVTLGKADMARIRAEVEAENYRKKCRKILQQYDTDNSGKLSKDQMIKLLTDLDSSTPAGTPPSEEELEFVIKSADYTGSFLGFADGSIDAEEIESAIVAWQTYTSKRSEIDEVFAKFDVSKTGQLDKTELKNYLTALNGNIPVSDAEVDWVMKISDLSQTGQLNKPEVLRATAEWYVYIKKGKKTGCCAVQ
jgi:Ca2+-binding EF-hand superfamily protein